MANAEFYGENRFGSDVYGVRLVCSSELDVASNSSRVTIAIYLVHGVISISERKYPTFDCTYGIDGTTYTYNTPAIKRASNDTPIVTKTVTIQHNSDGTKSVYVYANFPYNLKRTADGKRVNTVTASGTFVLDTVPRTSTIGSASTSVVVDGTNTWSVVMRKNSDAFRHRAYLTFGGNAFTHDFDTRTDIVIPAEWLNLIPTQMESTANAYIQTYSDDSYSTAIGDLIETQFTIKVPSDAVPVLSGGWASVSAYNAGTAAASKDFYVQGYSRALASFDVDKIAPRYGATIDRLELSWGGKTEGVLTPVITAYGNQKVRCTVTDSRGLQSWQEFDIYVYEYFLPTLSNISLYRCNSRGNADDSGTNIYAQASCRFAECGGQNSVSIAVQWKTVSESNWIGAASLDSGVGVVLGDGRIGSDASYNARIIAADEFGNIVSYAALIGTSEVAFNIKDGGKGAAFGKYAERDYLLDVPWAISAGGGFDAQMLAEYTDLNSVKTQNVYSGGNTVSNVYGNCPTQAAGFVLEVMSAGSDGRLMQRFTVCDKTSPVTYERFFYQGAWGTWVNKSMNTPSSEISQMLQYMYPIGSVYISAYNTSPASIFGGTWERIKDVFLLAAGDAYRAGDTGGEAAHTLTVDELPAHSHGAVYSHEAEGTSSYAWLSDLGNNMAYGLVNRGGNAAHNNMPPYKAFYMWQRIS